MAKIEALTDRFPSPALDASKWEFITTHGFTHSVNGQLWLSTVSGQPATAAGKVRSVDAWELADSYFHVTIGPPTDTDQIFGVQIVSTTTSESINMRKYTAGGGLNMWIVNAAGSTIYSQTVTWNSTSMARWRIRHTGTTMYFETAPATGVWTVQKSTSYTPAGTAYKVDLFSTWVDVTSATDVTFDNVNVTDYTITPTSIADTETLGAPTLAFTYPKMETLTDDFTGTLDTAKWTPRTPSAGTTVQTVSGQLELSTPAGATGGPFIVSADSAARYTLNDSAIYTKVGTVGGAPLNGGYYIGLRVRNTSTSEYFIFLRWGNTLYIRAYNPSNSAVIYTEIGYNATDHAWWRIRHSGTTLYMETSANGTAWTVRASATYTPAGQNLLAALELYWDSTIPVTAAGTAYFDNVNTAPPAPPVAPAGITDAETLSGPTLAVVLAPPSTLTDDFGGSGLDPAKWTNTSTAGNTLAVSGGLLTLTVTSTGQDTKAEATSVERFTLIGSSVFAKINPCTAGGMNTQLLITSGLGYAYFSVYQGTVYRRVWNASGVNILDNYSGWNATDWVYWRIRMDSSSVVYFDRSADGTTWVQVVSCPNPGWGANVDVRLTLNVATGTIAGAKTATVDAVNLVPSPAPSPNPDSLTDAETLDGPTLAFTLTHTPDPIADAETLDGPELVYLYPTFPDPTLDAETLDGPEVVVDIRATPDNLTDVETLDGPDLSPVLPLDPPSLEDTDLVGVPDAVFDPGTPQPETHTDAESLAQPGLVFHPSVINPAGLLHPEAFGVPDITFTAMYSGAYNTGTYGVGPYQGISFFPQGIVDTVTIGDPDIWTVPPVDDDNVLPVGITDPELFAAPQLPDFDATNYTYSEGTYGQGPYYGTPNTPTDDNPAPNPAYGVGTYNYGPYAGVSESPPSNTITPPFNDISGRVRPPLHILGIGPFSSKITWCGAPNYNIDPGVYPARPMMALPPATSKGFTLRLNESSEARFDLSFQRGEAVLVEEMDTDLWWRRKDPRTGQLEMIGRFNVAHLNLSASDTSLTCSAQLVDYRTILGDRMIMRYLHPTTVPPETMWDKGTPVMEIIKWIVPHNAGLDLTEIDTYNLGRTTWAYHLPPGTLLTDAFDNLEAVSPHRWEWWIDTPLDINKAPKLMFTIGERGRDNGITLFDHGTGPTPIAAWTRNAASDDYANSLYFTGGSGTGTAEDAAGGVVVRLDADITRYGQRDHQDGTSSIGGDIGAIRNRAMRKLQQLSDRRPSYDIRLKRGFWRGRNHIDVGDTITLILRMGKDLLQDKYRVSEINVEVDDQNEEDVSLTLGRLPVSADPRSKRAPNARIIRYLRNYIAPDGAADIPPFIEIDD